MAEIELKRVNIRIPSDIKEWYEKQAERMCISLTGAMAMALIEKYDREQNAIAVRKMSEMKIDDDTKKQLAELNSLLKEMQ